MPRKRDYEFGAQLGRGSFGVVYQVRRKTDSSTFVCKQITLTGMNRRAREEADTEVVLLRKISSGSEYIVQYVESFLEGDSLHLIMEYCENGDLCHFLKRQTTKLEEPVIWKWLLQIGLGLQWLHTNRILHRDIKTLNVFLTGKDDARLGDLGVARVLNHTQQFARTIIGTPFYLSPELCEEKPYNDRSDVWAYGCVIYEMCTLRHPFDAKNQAALIIKIVRGRYRPIHEMYSGELRSLLDSCMELDYTHRPGVLELLARPAVRVWADTCRVEIARPGESYDDDPEKAQAAHRLRSLSAKILRLQDDVVKDLDSATRPVWDNLYRFFRAKLATDVNDEDQKEIEKYIFEQLPTENTDLIWKVYKILQLELECDRCQHVLTPE